MDTITLLLVLVVVMVAVFDFTNGFHDAADMVATAIASRAMRPGVAIALLTFFTFLAPFTVGLAVADTIGTFVRIDSAGPVVGETLVIAALGAAVTYNLVTWRLGIPSSSSNSLAGGLVGAGLYAVGASEINWGLAALQAGHLEGVAKVIVGLFLSPLFGFLLGFALMKLLLRALARATAQVQHLFVASQYVSVAWLGFSHGGNDAQKGMALIAMMLLASGHSSEFFVPDWVIVLCASSITAGTLFGGWQIIKTLGFDLFRVRLLHSVASQLNAALVNSVATVFGAAEKPAHVRWKTAGSIVAGWLFNVPISIGLGFTYCYVCLRIWG
ncbi:inorganic phosphate transporter [Mangrovimicrobium sediminis]|uniref:Inorganic phosphate transporter n=1 Tax=Mangrovimicrobium sediminis TaxID=2562682 RepID=A0A4Z0M190_9GAMM|nr:inorganic phosphate transporter [Haliea sp. SAOS-164]TGD73289.1 inorganic phosphate transporter [Haliea sp. SAOS-164]